MPTLSTTFWYAVHDRRRRLVRLGVVHPLRSDVAFLREHVGDALLTWVGRSAYGKGSERGTVAPIETLEPHNAALATMRAALDARVKDWRRYAALFHIRNATSWANERVGEDLTAQIDHSFVLGPRGPVRTIQ